MCGRVYNAYNPRQLLRLAGTSLIQNQDKYHTGYNVTPTNYIPAIRHHSSAENNHRELDMVKWGYQAPFGQFIVNARVEEAAEKRTFRPLINTSRCVMIVQGYFEWTPKKVPFVFHPKTQSKVVSHDENDDNDKPPCIYIGGLIAPDNTLILLTRESFPGFDDVHERMPVVLDESEIDMWLDCDKYKFEKILFTEILNEKKEKWSQIGHYQTGPLVNSIKNKSEKVLQTLEEYTKDLDKTGIKKFFQVSTKKEKVPEQTPEKKIESEPEYAQKDLFKDEDSRWTQSTQATQAIQPTQVQPTQPTQAELAIQFHKHLMEEEECRIGDEESDFEDQNMNHIQRTLDNTGFGRDGRGLVAENVMIMYKKKEKSDEEKVVFKEGNESGSNNLKKRKEPTNSEEGQRTDLKQTKLG